MLVLVPSFVPSLSQALTLAYPEREPIMGEGGTFTNNKKTKS